MSEGSRKTHQDREDLAGEYKFGDTGQLILLVVFLIVWATDSFLLRVSTFLSGYIVWYIQVPLGVLIMFTSGYLAQNGLKTVFGETRDEPRVIDKGVFGLVRHPIYLGAILFYLAMIMFSISLLAITVFLIIITFYNYLARYEERLLLNKFGREYEEYMNRVPMWFPWLRKRKN